MSKHIQFSDVLASATLTPEQHEQIAFTQRRALKHSKRKSKRNAKYRQYSNKYSKAYSRKAGGLDEY